MSFFVTRDHIIDLINFKHHTDFLVRIQVERNPWFRDQLFERRVKIRNLLRQYNEDFASSPVLRYWTANDISRCGLQLVEILNEVILYQMAVCHLFSLTCNII